MKRILAQILFGLSLLGSGAAELTGDVDVRVRVIDAITKVPVAAEISLQKGDGESEKLGVATNGVFSFLRSGASEKVQLRALAENYSTRELSIELTNSRVSTVVELDRMFPFRGVVLAPNGQGAKDAKVVLIKAKTRFAMLDQKGGIETFGQLSVDKTREDGAFSIEPNEDGESLLVGHELGTSQMSLIGWTNGTVIRLRAWAVSKGRMFINNAPAGNESISAGNVTFPGNEWPINLQQFETQTDALGNFSFDKLPPGEVMLYRKVAVGAQSWTYSHGISFGVDQGFQAGLVYHLRGRMVRGKILVTGEKFDWNADLVIGTLLSKAGPVSEFSPMGATKIGTQIVAKIDNNRRLEATATPPGNYTFIVRAHKQDGSMQTIQTDVIVPEGNEPLELGEVTLKAPGN